MQKNFFHPKGDGLVHSLLKNISDGRAEVCIMEGSFTSNTKLFPFTAITGPFLPTCLLMVLVKLNSGIPMARI